MMSNSSTLVAETENVARILRRNWVVDGILQHYAFALRHNETYISVNRLAVETYEADVSAFVESHPDFFLSEEKKEYLRAILNVGDIRELELYVNNLKLDIDVEVESRDMFTKSHAGIFTRYKGHNIKTGDILCLESPQREISSDEVLLEVRSRLMDLAKMDLCKIQFR